MNKTIVTYSEVRKTYVRGVFQGKYHGIYDNLKDGHPFERFHNIKIYEGVLTIDDPAGIRRHPAGSFPDFIAADIYPGQLPNPLPCKINLGKESEFYELIIWDPSLKRSSVKILHSQEEGNEAFGVIEGELTGYLKDISVWDEMVDYDDPAVALPPDKTRTDVPTGKAEVKGNYTRKEYYYSDKSNTYWSHWKYVPAKSRMDGCYSTFGMLTGLGLLGFFLILIGLKGVGFMLLILLVISAVSLFQRVAGHLFGLVGLAMIGGFIVSLASVSKHKKRSQRAVPRDEQREISDTIKRRNPDSTITDFISHHRVWNDYSGKTYEGNLTMPVNFSELSAQNRLTADLTLTTNSSYDAILYQLAVRDADLLGTVYSMFDSIGRSNNLNRQLFAEMIVSCIQDIPYTLILQQECDAALYNDQFISEYLSEGKVCTGNTRYGLFAPAEFVANLKGDCDTRTLLLYDLLSYFGYDVAILSSEAYRHSMIAISLPYSGTYLQVNSDKFYPWETTNKGFYPGVLPSPFDDMRKWRVSLIHYSSK